MYTCGRALAVGLGGDMLAVSSASGEIMVALLKWGGVFLRGVMVVVTRGNISCGVCVCACVCACVCVCVCVCACVCVHVCVSIG